MKVAYLLGSLNRGGAETLLLDVFHNTEKAPYEMVCIHRRGGAYLEDYYATGIKMIQCASKRFGLLRYLWRLRKILQSENISVVHAQQPLDAIYVRVASMGLHIPLIQTLHGYYPMNGISGYLTRLSIRMSDELCFVSKYEQDWYQRHVKIADEKCHVIYNGIDFAKFDSAKSIVESQELRANSGLKLCMVGNFVAVRDHVTLFKALCLLNERGINDFDIFFIGKRVEEQAEIYDTCERIVNENNLEHVHFMGGRGDVPKLLKSMDGFVYSTDHDTFGIAIVEAMAAGLPVVVNDYAVMKEVCGDMVAYYKSKDVEDCANTIEKLLVELPQRKETAKKNAALVRKRYSIESYIATLTEVYNQKNRKL